jgi:phosphoesterase RecJ-like protein
MLQVIKAIREYKRFLITAHVNPEGDSLCSQLAMKELLEIMGKTGTIVNQDNVPEHYRFLPKADEIITDLTKKVDFDAVLVLDCPTFRRAGRVKDLIPKGKPIINIDHHISSEHFGEVNWVDPNASSTGEMVYRLYRELDIPLTREVALCLYIAILTDTGSFNYENTSRLTHDIAGELLGYGLDPAMVSESVYERRTLEDIRLLGLVLSTLKVNLAGDVAYLELTREMMEKTGADIAKSEGFINYARSIGGVKIAMLFKEDKFDHSKINISFRSKGDVDVNGIAAYFGGGGHTKASGCMVTGSLAEVERRVLDKVEEILARKH